MFWKTENVQFVKNNKVKDNNIRAKTFIRSVCFCLLSGGVAFLSAIGQFTVIETQLIVLFLGIIFAIYYAYYNKNIQTSLENIVWLFHRLRFYFCLLILEHLFSYQWIFLLV